MKDADNTGSSGSGIYNKSYVLIALLILLPAISILNSCRADTKEKLLMDEIKYEGYINAPEFPTGLEWINTDQPLKIKDLKGKIVLLDFWTYCCINCMHVIPDLKKLEAKYKDELVVIGIHSAKFLTEQETENIREAVLRYEIEHPVVNDRNMIIWRTYGVRAWPTLVLINPLGKIVGFISGEGIYASFDEMISNLIQIYDKKGLIDRKPLDLQPESQSAPAGILQYPGKVLADEKNRRLFIADSNHNRIILLSLVDNSVEDTIGSGKIGLQDGSYAEAEFNHPQGMALDGDDLYIADTENHALQKVDLKKKTVRTISCDGRQAGPFDKSGIAARSRLNSPWDIVIHKGILYIAMAGPHQIWRMDIKKGELEIHAGSGYEGRMDGSLRRASLAQPSGITTDGKKLYFADSEVSSIRAADIDPSGAVETIVGLDLFEFGDRDGSGSEVRLQHPLGVVYHDGLLYVADTYNNKIKVIDPVRKTAKTLLGSGRSGMKDGIGKKATFNEPGGLSIAGNKIYIADTNNHLIRIADLKSLKVETLQIMNPDRLKPSAVPDTEAKEAAVLNPVDLSPGETKLRLDIKFPKGYKINKNAPSYIRLRAEDHSVVEFGSSNTVLLKKFPLPVRVPIKTKEGRTTITIETLIYYCSDENESLCLFDEAIFVQPVYVTGSSKGKSIPIILQIGKK